MSRFDLTEFEWSIIEPMLPQDVRGVKRCDDRQVLNGIFYVLRTGVPWADAPERYGPAKTLYNRFYRWNKAGVWDRLMDAVVDAFDGNIMMVDGTSVRVHHSGATVKKTIPNDVWDDLVEVLTQKSMHSSITKDYP